MVEADDMGCHIITAPADVLKKLPTLGTKTGSRAVAWGGASHSAKMRLSPDLHLAVPASRAAE